MKDSKNTSKKILTSNEQYLIKGSGNGQVAHHYENPPIKKN